ncbi:MAG: hypothetical protein ABMA00_07845 [Gemmatimonas sp.]
MIASLFRLLALRPLLSMAILGIPVLMLVAVGLVTIFAVKALIFVVLPIVLVVWLVRRFMRRDVTDVT